MTDVLNLDYRAAMTEMEKTAAGETYLELEDLIRKQVWKVIQRYGGDFDELMSEAACIFLAAYKRYPGGIPFSQYCRQWVYWSLIDELRVQIGRRQRIQNVDENLLVSSYRDWNVANIIDELTEDAATIIKLVVETPAELAEVIAGKGGQPRNYRSSIRVYLSGLGWTASRIAESFNEIRAALSE